MEEYNIDVGEDLYFPRTERWVMDSLGLKLDYAVYYQMILNKGYVTWSRQWTAHVLGCSEEKVKDMQVYMVNKGVLAKRTDNTDKGGNRRRSVYVALYTREGRRPDYEVEQLLQAGMNKITLEYSEPRYYKKRKGR